MLQWTLKRKTPAVTDTLPITSARCGRRRTRIQKTPKKKDHPWVMLHPLGPCTSKNSISSPLTEIEQGAFTWIKGPTLILITQRTIPCAPSEKTTLAKKGPTSGGCAPAKVFLGLKSAKTGSRGDFGYSRENAQLATPCWNFNKTSKR